MKILLTFEVGSIPVHCIDVIRMLKHRGHEIDYFNPSKEALNDPFGYFPEYTNMLSELGNVDQYDLWLYDLSSWDGPKTPFLEKMENFNGYMVCINYEDGYGFFLERASDMVVDKTKMFVNNTLRKDRSLYDSRIRHKLFLSTSYITNSQDFKGIYVPFNDKIKRAIFTGNITGHSESGNQEERKCRILVPMALIKAEFPCFYRIYSSDPSYKQILEEVPEQYRSTHMARGDFIRETINSAFILSLRGNGHTVNRFFEGLASGGLVFSTRFRHSVDFIGCGEAGVHYVEIEWDGSDVVEKATYYLHNQEEAEKIARNGRLLWEEYSMLDKNKILQPKVVDYYVRGFKEIGNIDI